MNANTGRVRGLRVLLNGETIGDLHWTFGNPEWKAGGWYATSREMVGTPARPRYSTGPKETEAEAGKRLCEMVLARQKHQARQKAIQETWETFDKPAARALVEREVRRVIKANRTDLGHCTRQRFRLVLTFRKAHTNTGGRGGPAGVPQIKLTVGPMTPWYDLQWVILHELSHCVHGTTPRGSGRKRIVHGPKFQEAFCRLAERAHGVDCWGGCNGTVIWSRTKGPDGVLRKALEARHGAITLNDKLGSPS